MYSNILTAPRRMCVGIYGLLGHAGDGASVCAVLARGRRRRRLSPMSRMVPTQALSR